MAAFKVVYKQNPLYESAKYHDKSALDDVIGYCLNPLKTPHHFIGGMGVSVNQAAYEMKMLAQAFGKTEGIQLRQFILAFSKDEVAQFQDHIYETLYEIAWCTAEYYGYSYQIIFAVHENPDHPHIHFVMSPVNFMTGKKYRGDKADYYSFQKYLSDFLYERYGLPLEVFSDHGYE